MISQFYQTGENGQINLSGELTVQYASELHAALVEAQNTVTDLVVNLEDISEVDVSCLQLMCAAHRSAVRFQKSFALGKVCPEVKKAVEETGYIRRMGCLQGSGANCLWLDSGKDASGLLL
jgi:anti-anti-sigma factor